MVSFTISLKFDNIRIVSAKVIIKYSKFVILSSQIS